MVKFLLHSKENDYSCCLLAISASSEFITFKKKMSNIKSGFFRIRTPHKYTVKSYFIL